MKFTTIKEDHPDISDYDTFFCSLKRFIKKNCCDGIQHDISHIVKAAQEFKNPVLIANTIDLLASVDYGEILSDDFIVQHIVSGSEPILNYIFNKSLKNYYIQVSKLVLDTNIYTKTLSLVLQMDSYAPILDTFLFRTNRLLEKQARVRYDLSIYHNLDTLVKNIGNISIAICNATFELFLKFATNLKSSVTIGNLLFCRDFLGMTEIEFKSKIEVDDVNNFLFFFYDFFDKETQDIIETLDVSKIEDVLAKKYLISSKGVKISRRIKNLKKSNLVFGILEEECELEYDSDEEFEVLFSSVTNKNVCDCYEF